MMRQTRRWFFFVLFLTITFFSVVFSIIATTGMKCDADVVIDPQAPTIQKPTFPQDYYSKEESSFLIFPEWYIVFSADEYGEYLKHNKPSSFPYFAAIKQYWQSYACVVQYTDDKYEFNQENHLVSMVIGVSYSVEYSLKGLYELTIGRINEIIAGGNQVEEEVFAQKVAAEYGTFLHTQAWFLFPFWERLVGLWQETELTGPHILRKWERKIILSTEYLLKGAYGWVLKKATYSTIGQPDLTTELWTSSLSPEVATASANIKVFDSLTEESDVVQVPRYEEFKKTIPTLFENGVKIYEIGGNDLILTTVIAPRDWQSTKYPKLFEMNIVSLSDKKRVGIPVPVTVLDVYLQDLKTENIQLEHIYDY